MYFFMCISALSGPVFKLFALVRILLISKINFGNVKYDKICVFQFKHLNQFGKTTMNIEIRNLFITDVGFTGFLLYNHACEKDLALKKYLKNGRIWKKRSLPVSKERKNVRE